MQNIAIDAQTVLRRAAEILEEGGWKQRSRGPLDNVSAPHCAIGALQAAMVDLNLEMVLAGPGAGALRSLTAALRRTAFEAGLLPADHPMAFGWAPIPLLNDLPGMNADLVQHAFKLAVEAAELTETV